VPEDATRSLCQRRKLVVDFNEIGWGEWIISPKTFEAHYCAGRCPFPLTKVKVARYQVDDSLTYFALLAAALTRN
jgi:hypothetical protein